MFVTFSNPKGYKKVTQKVTPKTAGRGRENRVCNFVTLILAQKISSASTRGLISGRPLGANRKIAICVPSEVTRLQWVQSAPLRCVNPCNLSCNFFVTSAHQKGYRGDAA